MPFSERVRNEVLVKSHRCCCVCHEFSGRSVNVHHIIQEADGGSNDIQNAICLCLRCHAEAGHFNSRHPLGTKYSPRELKLHRDQWWVHCSKTENQKNTPLSIKFKRVFTSQDVHRYHLLVSYTNTTAEAYSDWKIILHLPEFLPTDYLEMDDPTKIEIEGKKYNSFTISSFETIYPDETNDVLTSIPDVFFLEYEINSKNYNQLDGKELVKWKFYSSRSPVQSGETLLSELHEF